MVLSHCGDVYAYNTAIGNDLYPLNSLNIMRKSVEKIGTLFLRLAPVEQTYFEKQIREVTAWMNFKAALEKYKKKKEGA